MIEVRQIFSEEASVSKYRNEICLIHRLANPVLVTPQNIALLRAELERDLDIGTFVIRKEKLVKIYMDYKPAKDFLFALQKALKW